MDLITESLQQTIPKAKIVPSGSLKVGFLNYSITLPHKKGKNVENVISFIDGPLSLILIQSETLIVKNCERIHNLASFPQQPLGGLVDFFSEN